MSILKECFLKTIFNFKTKKKKLFTWSWSLSCFFSGSTSYYSMH